MKTVKIQSSILKEKSKVNQKAWIFERYDDYVYIVDPKGHVMYIIHQDKFYLDIERLDMNVRENLHNLISQQVIKDSVPANITVEKTEDKMTIAKIVANDGNYCYLNKDNLKNFDKPELRISGKNKPILMYENGSLVGMTMPMRVPEEF